jgi:sugar lactone lactonase YvrE
MFIIALFKIANLWNQRRCPSTSEWIKKMWYIPNGVLFSHKEKSIYVNCMKMDGTEVHHVE